MSRRMYDQTIFNLNFATFLHIFYIEKYQEYAYFDKFLVFVQKNGKMQILGQLDAKRKAGTWFERKARKEGLNCTARRDRFAPYRISTARAGVYLQTFKSFGAELRFLKNWVSANPKLAPPPLFFWVSDFREIDHVPGRITTRAKHESWSSGTHESSWRRIAKKDPVEKKKSCEEDARALVFPAEAGDGFQPKYLRFKDELGRADQSKVVARIKTNDLSPKNASKAHESKEKSWIFRSSARGEEIRFELGFPKLIPADLFFLQCSKSPANPGLPISSNPSKKRTSI